MAMGSADNKSSYVFGLHLNFDPSLLPENIEIDAKAKGDYRVPLAQRRYARLWLEVDYKKSAAKGQRVKKTGKSVEEVKEELDGFTQLPKKGMQVHAEYTMLGHYFLLKALVRASPRVTLYLDRESGIEGIICGVFEAEIREEKVQAYLVSINKLVHHHFLFLTMLVFSHLCPQLYYLFRQQGFVLYFFFLPFS